MTTDESIMQEMLDRITNTEKETADELGIQMFCLIVQSNFRMITKAHEMILNKVRTNDAKIASRAMGLLEECMQKCGNDFQHETAKNRFLNSLIELVSPNYQGNHTPVAIKMQILNCLKAWTQRYPHEPKIQKVYDSLSATINTSDQASFIKSSFINAASSNGAATDLPQRESILGVKEQNFAKLLQSGNPQDLQKANLLLQQCVKENTRREELVLQHKNELQEVQITVGLLKQMLDVYEEDENSHDSDTVSLIQELYKTCKRHKAIVEKLPDLIENKDEKLIQETIDTNTMLQEVMERFKACLKPPKNKTISSTKTPTVETAVTQTEVVAKHADLLTGLLDDETFSGQDESSKAILPETAATNVAKPATKIVDLNSMDELNDIFASLNTVSVTNADDSSKILSTSPISGSTQHTTHRALFGNLELLEPISVFDAKESSKKTCEEGGANQKRAMRELREIDQMSEALFMQNLNNSQRVGSFKKDNDKISLNDLVKDRANISKNSNSSANNLKSPSHTMISAFEIASNIEMEEQCRRTNDDDDDDESMLNDNSTSSNSSKAKSQITATHNVNADNTTSVTKESSAIVIPQKPLSEIHMDLDEITATSDERLLLDDDDVKVTLSLTAEKPSRHVSVIVLSVVNKSKLVLNDFRFEVSVKKPCKVRLLEATDSTIAAHKPFRPPAPINQVMLLLNPTGQAVDVTCIVGYKLGDDPDPFKVSIVAKDLPFIE